MEDGHDDALLERASSSEIMSEPRRNHNTKALKVTSLTVLACLLLAGQAFTAYFVVKQKDHLQALESGQDSLKKEMTRMLKVAPKIMQTPTNKMSRMLALDEPSSKPHIPLTKLEPSNVQVPKEGSGLVDGLRQTSKMIIASMPLVKDFAEDFAKPELPAEVLETKCKLEAQQVKPGSFQPQCDEEGNFKPKQCWHSTGYCWCVDKNGKEIPGSLTRGQMECGNVN